MATKPTTPKTPKPAAKPRAAVARAAKPKASAVEMEDAMASDGAAKAANGLRMKELVESVAASTDVKKKDVRTVLEAALVQMGEALKKGDSLNLVGLGRMRVARAATEDGGAMTLKLRMATPGEKAEKADADPLADADDQD